MTEILKLIAAAFMQYGSIGLLAIVGWSLAFWFIYRDSKKKEEIATSIKDKDVEISKINSERITDLKEISKDYHELTDEVNRTLDKLTVALKVKDSLSGSE